VAAKRGDRHSDTTYFTKWQSHGCGPIGRRKSLPTLAAQHHRNGRNAPPFPPFMRESFRIQNHTVTVATINLAQPWTKISADLLGLLKPVSHE
jgi:hypothetical protein